MLSRLCGIFTRLVDIVQHHDGIEPFLCRLPTTIAPLGSRVR